MGFIFNQASTPSPQSKNWIQIPPFSEPRIANIANFVTTLHKNTLHPVPKKRPLETLNQLQTATIFSASFNNGDSEKHTSRKRQLPREQHQREAMEKEEELFAQKISDYELSREERIKENRERMQKLGIVDLSVKLKALKPAPKRAYQRKMPLGQSPLPPSGPVRRSSRLQNSTPVSYCKVHVAKKESLNGDDFLREEGSKPELYTDEHEKLLGSSEKSWTLFVDGYGNDGKRIYDPVKGKTCHQCRYGENVLEANENPNWLCPVCRGICNCSLCRQAKGWPPTGTLYRKISSLGYKSVAHYLIQTRRSNTDSDKNVGTQVPVSAKRSLPFSEIEVTKADDDLSKPSGECLNTDPICQFDKENGHGKIAPESEGEPLLKPDDVASQSNDQVDYPSKPEPEKNSVSTPDCINEKYSARKDKNAPKIADVDSIASRLKMRRRV